MTASIDRYLRGVGPVGTGRIGETVDLELQDAYLADDTMPSQRGRLAIDDDFTRFPQFAVSLGLLRRDSFSPLVRGHTFVRLLGDLEMSAFRSYQASCNPLLLTDSQVLLLLYCLLEKDLDVLPALAKGLLALPTPFNDSQAGDLLPGVIEQAVARLKPRTLAASDIARLHQLSETAKAIAQRKGGRFGKTVREQTITPRLEAFVDLKILSKPNPLAYEYALTTKGRTFLEDLGRSKEPESFIATGYVGAASSLTAMKTSKIDSESRVLELCHEAWKELASGLGYAPITDTALLGTIRALEAGHGYFESSVAQAAMKSAQHLSPPLVRLNVDRWGRITVVKFLKAP
ncbi:MAG: hypothetical protein EXR78_09755 [Deltaproteobacteria bacterium]|nr:hypothetical protein [Deltaproteobacteria bacterium]